MEYLYFFSLMLSIVGSINWGLVGLTDFDLVKFMFGENTLLSRIVYLAVGLSGIYLLCYTFTSNNFKVQL